MIPVWAILTILGGRISNFKSAEGRKPIQQVQAKSNHMNLKTNDKSTLIGMSYESKKNAHL